MAIESNVRAESGVRLRIKSAGFPAIKTITDFDFGVQPGLDRAQIARLEGGGWLADSGATHMARDGPFIYLTDALDRAEALFDRVVAEILDKNDDISVVTASGASGVPDVRCLGVITPYPRARPARCFTTPTSPRSAPRPSPVRIRRPPRST